MFQQSASTQLDACMRLMPQCWPSKLSASDLQAGSDEVMIEELTIQQEFLDWV